MTNWIYLKETGKYINMNLITDADVHSSNRITLFDHERNQFDFGGDDAITIIEYLDKICYS